ncbi:2-3-bisphosphoglycerate-dependent phosphoglycerate mutase [Diplonema papillatum]|nr:2-3-bisphosphoglycerate-dependent phosphoglycerate mutase [Diplonema papillatum]KAJ9447891.1 2-3-bisphosphoglycerate-dependent phosphoglycerate mutase [Diplonema papillatum]
MATKIFVVRHGQDEDNKDLILNGQHRDRPLTELGREQAAAVAAKVCKLDIDVVLSSPQQRALFTAKAIHSACGLPEDKLVVNDLLKERDFGVLGGQPVSKIQEVAGDNVLKTDRVTYFLDVPGCETFPVLLRRGKDVVDYINENFAGKRVVAVGHGDINKMVRAAYMQWNWEHGLKTAYVDNTSIIELPPEHGDDESNLVL